MVPMMPGRTPATSQALSPLPGAMHAQALGPGSKAGSRPVLQALMRDKVPERHGPPRLPCRSSGQPPESPCPTHHCPADISRPRWQWYWPRWRSLAVVPRWQAPPPPWARCRPSRPGRPRRKRRRWWTDSGRPRTPALRARPAPPTKELQLSSCRTACRLPAETRRHAAHPIAKGSSPPRQPPACAARRCAAVPRHQAVHSHADDDHCPGVVRQGPAVVWNVSSRLRLCAWRRRCNRADITPGRTARPVV